LGFRLKEEMHDKMKEFLDENNISYTTKRKRFFITVDKKLVEQNKEIFIRIAEFAKESRN
jgi:DNA-directed RNA polymerase subunit E'/Rpb7